MITSRPSIRERRREDLPVLAEIISRVHVNDLYPARGQLDAEAFVATPRAFEAYVAVDPDGALVGHVALASADDDAAVTLWEEATGRPPEELVVIKRLFTDPAKRRSGGGRALLERSVAHAHELGRQPVLDVDAHATAAISLYEKSGFRLAGRVELAFTPGGSVLVVLCYVGPPPGNSSAEAG